MLWVTVEINLATKPATFNLSSNYISVGQYLDKNFCLRKYKKSENIFFFFTKYEIKEYCLFFTI